MDYYGIEIVDDVAYTEKLNYEPTAFGKQRNDFEGDKEACHEYLKSKEITEVYGALKGILG